MKTFVLIITIFFQTFLINAQIIKNPSISARSDSTSMVEIDQVELTENSTIISFIAKPKGIDIFIPSDTYIISSDGGKKLYLQTSIGVTIGEPLRKSRNGKQTFKLVFPALDKDVKRIDYRGDGNNWHFFEINTDPNFSNALSLTTPPDRGIIVKNGIPWKYINNPKYTAKSDNSFRISRVELADTATVLYFEITRLAGNWVYIPADSYIQSSDGGEFLYITAAEGTSFDEEIWLEDTGIMTYKLYFPKIDERVKKINFKVLNKSGNMSVFELDISMN